MNELATALLSWYQANARTLPWRETSDPYPIWISEIMLQQTRVAAVLGYYQRFLTALPTVADLACVDEDSLMKLWEGLGYYSRARNLQKAARMVMADFDGQFPQTVAGLESLPGIGPYTSAAVASAAFGVQAAAVDGNVLRVVTRLLDAHDDISLPATKKMVTAWVTQHLPPPGVQMQHFNQAMMELGATVCGPNSAPKCDQCPLSALCLGRERGTADTLPVKAPKKPRRQEQKTVFCLLQRGTTALYRRENKGLLASLWAFPNVEGHLSEAEVAQQLSAWGLRIQSWHWKRTATHMFTHVEWDMVGYCLDVEEMGLDTWQWVDKQGLSACAVPSAFGAFYKEVACDL